MKLPDARAVSVLDMTVAQVEALELEVGLPIQRWKDAPSVALLFSAILSSVEGKPRESYASLTMRELAERVDLTGARQKGGADPQSSGGPS